MTNPKIGPRMVKRRTRKAFFAGTFGSEFNGSSQVVQLLPIFRRERFRLSDLSAQRRDKELAGKGDDSIAGQLANPTVTPRTRGARALVASSVGRQSLLFSRHFVGNGEQQELVILCCFA